MKQFLTSSPLIAGVAAILAGRSTDLTVGKQGSGLTMAQQVKIDSLACAKRTEKSPRMKNLLASAKYPYIKEGKWSGVIPVADPTEIPDLNRD